MSSQPIQHKYREDALSDVRGELLEALLQPDEDCYPWNPAEPEAEAYFAELERGFLLSGWQEDDKTTQASQAFFHQLHQCWTSSMPVAEDTLNVSLSDRFAAVVPQAWLEAIANQARQIVQANLSVADQLVLCVKPLLPNWAEDDLLVLARPLAYAMRGNSDSTDEGAPSVVRPAQWTELSSMEQARLTLAVAHWTLAQLKNGGA